MTTPRPLVAGNWKMNGLKASQSEIATLMEAVATSPADCEILICPPFTLISRFADLTSDSPIAIGAQDCHMEKNGAHTGDISAEMLRDAGASYVIVGHSERRADHGESDILVRAKAAAVHDADLCAIICVGETEAERDAGQTLDIVLGQLEGSAPKSANAKNSVIAYEPVWAIGTGRVPTIEDVGQVHAAIRDALHKRFGEDGALMRILYGGSVKPSNAKALMSVAHVNGALVGGASLKAGDFDQIIDAYR